MRPNIVCIGGGTGQSEVLRGLKEMDCNITAIVAVTDSGRSTGVIRKNFNIPAPGDLRNCIVSLSESEPLLQKLFQHRFDKGKNLKGMSFGNLFLTAMTKIEGDLFSGVKETSKILKIKGKVLPSTNTNTQVCAELMDGKIVEEELNVREVNKAPIKRIFLKDKSARTSPGVVKAIKKADLIVIGPGSLYTSVLVHFLLPNLRDAIKKAKGKKVFLCNLITQSGQTDNYSLSKHVEEVVKYLGRGVLDYVILNNNPPGKKIMKEYEREGGYLLDINNDEKNKIKKLGVRIIEGDILKKETKKTKEWNKVSSIRHDPRKTAKLLYNLVKKDNGLKAVILAAGNGTRMRPFSFTESKTMIKFLGKPLLAYHIDECLANNIKDIIIVCNRFNIREIKTYFSKNYSAKIKFVLQKEQKGVSHAVMSARKYLSNCHFLLKNGDSISSIDETKHIIELYRKKKTDIILTLRKVKETKEYGIARFNGKEVIGVVEKPKKDAPSNYATVGLYILDSEKFFKGLEKSSYDKDVPPPQFVFSEGGKSNYWVTDAKRFDLGRAWNILEVNKLLIERVGGKVESKDIEEGVKINKNSYIGPDAVIGKGVVIEGYCSIEGYIGKNSKIVDSVIMEGTKIGKRCHIEASVIGRDNLIDDNFKTISNGKSKEKGLKIYVKGRYVNPTIKKAGIFTGQGVRILENLKSYPGKMVFPYKLVKEDIKKDLLIRAILFDADNTIYATKKIAKKADMAAMRFFAEQKKGQKKISAEKMYEEWKKIIKPLINEKDPKKRTRKYSYSLLVKKMKINHVNEGFDIFLRELIKDIKLMPSFIETINKLNKYKLAVFSEDTSDLTIPKLKKFNLERYFDMILTADMIGHMKPSKEYYKTVFKKIDVEPTECLIIGDNYEKDLKIAQEMGATTACFGSDKRADFSFDDYKDLPIILGKI